MFHLADQEMFARSSRLPFLCTFRWRHTVLRAIPSEDPERVSCTSPGTKAGSSRHLRGLERGSEIPSHCECRACRASLYFERVCPGAALSSFPGTGR